MIRLYADDDLVYDSRLEDYELLQLTSTSAVNRGGSAQFMMPPLHPAYNRFVSFKTIVTLFKDEKLIFRGRPLYPSDDFSRRRTIVCEGELCFLRDAISRPYEYQDSPENVFLTILQDYNRQVEPEKQFVPGQVTVTDPNDYIRLYAENPETVADTMNKLLQRCGGYLIVTDQNGARCLNWFAEVNFESSQTIEFGENLLDFTRSSNTDLATRIIPYGAKDPETGTRISIESVNGGLDYVEDPDAIALRGTISKVVLWDDVTEPQNLLIKANAYLASIKNVITEIQLTAVDMSALGLDIDFFRVCDRVHTISKPHDLDDWMLLQSLTIDYLDPANSLISLGKSFSTLSGSDVSADRDSRSEMHRIDRDIRTDVSRDFNASLDRTSQQLSSQIQQTDESIRTMVQEQYLTGEEVTEMVSTSVTQLSDSIQIDFQKVQKQTDDLGADMSAQFQRWSKYIRFEEGNILLGESGNEITLKIENDQIGFYDSGAKVAYFSNKKLYVTSGEFIEYLQLGKFAFVPRENGNLSFRKVVD